MPAYCAHFHEYIFVTCVILPKAIMSHQSQLFSREANSVECLTIRVHLASESPNPDNAPYRAAIVWQKHISSRKPIQLNRNATASERIWMTLLVRERERTVTTMWVVWLTVNIRPTFWLMGLCTHRFTVSSGYTQGRQPADMEGSCKYTD